MTNNIFIKGFYGWGTGYHSIDKKYEWDRLVIEFCEKNYLDITFSWLHSPKLKTNQYEIYFHPMETTFTLLNDDYKNNIDNLQKKFMEFLDQKRIEHSLKPF